VGTTQYKRISVLSFFCLLLLAACSQAPQQTQEAPKKRQPERAPDIFKVKLETSRGNVVAEVRRDWAPHGADRFYGLVQDGFYRNVRFHRVVRNFIVQFGINPDPAVSQLWSKLVIPDDPPREKNARGTITFAKLGVDSRTTQVFINLKDNSASLDKTGFVPFGKVIEGMDVVERLYNSYGEAPPRGAGPDPTEIEIRGNKYLEDKFPRLDYIKRATILQ